MKTKTLNAKDVREKFLHPWEEIFKEAVASMESSKPPRNYRKRHEASLRANKECLQKLWDLKRVLAEFEGALDKADVLLNF